MIYITAVLMASWDIALFERIMPDVISLESKSLDYIAKNCLLEVEGI